MKFSKNTEGIIKKKKLLNSEVIPKEITVNRLKSHRNFKKKIRINLKKKYATEFMFNYRSNFWKQ